MKKIELIVPDIDGMLLHSAKFSEAFPKKFGVSAEAVGEMFAEDFEDCKLGKKDLREAIEARLSSWGTDASVDDVLKFWFGLDNPEQDVIDFLKDLRQKGVKIVLGTNQEKYRLEHILKSLRFIDWTDGVVASCDIGIKKPAPEFYQEILNRFPEMDKSAVLIFDDKEENIQALRGMGFNAEVYENLDSLKQLFIDKYEIK